MTVQSRTGRWGTAGWAVVLVGAGLLTRSACAPAPLPGVRGPSAPAAEARTEGAPNAATNDAASVSSVAGRAPVPEASLLASPAPTVRQTPFTSGNDPQPSAAGIESAGSAPASGGLPTIEKREVALLASIERDLKREPPPEVHALLGEYRRGADRATLVATVQREFPSDLAMRVTVLRWIDQVRPAPGGPPPAPAVPGQGTRKSWVRPLNQPADGTK